MTLEHKKELEERLEHLKVVGRPDAAEKIRIAREFGDLSENAEYDIAKEEQAKMEAEISEIELKLRFSKIIEEKRRGSEITYGSKITIENLATKERFEYSIVGESEANPFKGTIEISAPIANALVSKKRVKNAKGQDEFTDYKAGDEFSVHTPAGDFTYKLVKVG